MENDLCRQLLKRNQSKGIKRAKNDCTRFLGCVSYDNSIELHTDTEKDGDFSQNSNSKYYKINFLNNVASYRKKLLIYHNSIERPCPFLMCQTRKIEKETNCKKQNQEIVRKIDVYAVKSSL